MLDPRKNGRCFELVWPGCALPAVRFFTDNRLGDSAGVLALLVSTVGFATTLWNVWRTKTAAERAAEIADEIRGVMSRFSRDVDDLQPILAKLQRKEEAGA